MIVVYLAYATAFSEENTGFIGVYSTEKAAYDAVQKRVKEIADEHEVVWHGSKIDYGLHIDSGVVPTEVQE